MAMGILLQKLWVAILSIFIERIARTQIRKNVYQIWFRCLQKPFKTNTVVNKVLEKSHGKCGTYLRSMPAPAKIFGGKVGSKKSGITTVFVVMPRYFQIFL